MEAIKKALIPYFDEDKAEEIARAINSGLPVMICGIQGPTGKSTLCRALKKLGINAHEPWEVEFVPKKEKIKKDNSNAAYIEIVLNAPIKSL